MEKEMGKVYYGGQNDISFLSTYEIPLENNQIVDFKYATFDDPFIDSQLKFEITYDTVISDITCCIDTIIFFDNLYTQSLDNTKIYKEFRTHKISYINSKAFLFILKRQLNLLLYLIKYKFDGDNHALKYIKEEYLIEGELRFKITEMKDFFIFKELQYDNCKEKIASELEEVICRSENFEKELLHDYSNRLWKPSITGLSILIKFINSSFNKAITDLEILLKDKNHKLSEGIILDFFQVLIKTEIFISLIPLAYKVKECDLFNLKENSPEWIGIKYNYERIITHSGHTMRKKIQKFISLITMGNASIHKGFSFENNYLKFIGTGYYIAYFFFNRQRALLESKRFSLKPQLELSRKVWHLLDAKGIKHGYKGLLYGIASIKTREKLFFKKSFKPITLDYLYDINDKLSHGITNFPKLDEIKDIISLDILTQGEILEKSVKKDKRKNYVKIKLLFHNNFYIPRFKSNWKFNFFKYFGMEKNFTRNALVIHIHGGGFIAMSSNSHENYLRKWCNKLEVPVISIDYGLSPENPYPMALDDVWQAYNWIISYSAHEFGISLDKIILVGDSAGGNLVLSLVYLLIINHIRLPDALILAYPALRVSDDFFSPSFLLSLNDVILSYHLLKYCLQSYKQEYTNSHCPFLSPIYANDYLLKNLPPVRILVGSSDPLRDDCLRLLQRLCDLGKDAKLCEFKYFPHGFLSYDLPLLLPEASVANEYIVNEIEKFLSL